MKLSEIQVGSDYAVQRYGGLNRMRCLEVGEFTKTVYRGSSFHGHKSTQKGARFATVRSDGTLATEGHDGRDITEWFRSQAVQCDWAAHEKVEQARKNRDQTLAQLAADLTTRLQAIDEEAFRYTSVRTSEWVGSRRTDRVHLTLDARQLRVLLEAAEAGQKATTAS